MRSGDHICARRSIGLFSYMHHGIYINKNEVIHFDGAPFRDNRDTVIRSCTLDEFAPDGWTGVIPYEGDRHYPYFEVVERAKNQLGDKHDYSLSNGTSDHFATWSPTGVQ